MNRKQEEASEAEDVRAVEANTLEAACSSLSRPCPPMRRVGPLGDRGSYSNCGGRF